MSARWEVEIEEEKENEVRGRGGGVRADERSAHRRNSTLHSRQDDGREHI